MSPSPNVQNFLHFVGGVVLVLLGHLFFLGLVLLGVIVWSTYLPRPSQDYWEIGVLIVALMGLGVFQLLYVVPLTLYLRARSMTMAWQAVVVTAALTLLGSGICGSMAFF